MLSNSQRADGGGAHRLCELQRPLQACGRVFKATPEKHLHLLFICDEEQVRGDFCLLSSPDCSCHVHLLIYVIHAGVRGSKPAWQRRARTAGTQAELPAGTGLLLIQMALLQLLPKPPGCIITASCLAR